MSSDGYNLGNAYGRIVISDNVDQAVRDAQRAFDRGISGMGRRMQQFGDSMTGLGTRLTALTAPLAAFGFTGVRTAMNFESAMAEISARTGLVGDDLEEIADAAKQMGAETVFSAQDAANAFLELLSSGQSAEEALQTLPFVLQAAAAGGIELGQAADTVTDILAAFNLNVDDAEAVVDALARASGASSADIASLQQGFGNVGGVAAQFGLSVDETASILAIFSENGIKGAEAGTQLRSMLLNMTRPTEAVQSAWDTLGVSVFDAEGNMRDLNVVMGEVTEVMNSGRFTQEEMNQLLITIAGSYGVMGFTALTAGQSIGEMQTMMDEQADATTIAEARMNTFEGALNSLKGSIETLQIEALTPFMNNVLTPMVEKLTEIINRVTDWAEENPELAGTIAMVAGAAVTLGPALVAIGLAIGAIGTAIVALTSPIALGIAAGAALYLAWKTNFLGIRDAVQEVIDKINELINMVTEAPDVWRGNADQFGQIVQGLVEDPGRMINAIGEGTGLFDSGGYARSQIAHVGRGQMGREAFLVGDQGGTFYPDFAANLARIAGDVMMSRNMPSVGQRNLSQPSGTVIENLTIEVPVEVLRDEPGLQQNAETLGNAIMERIRRGG